MVFKILFYAAVVWLIVRAWQRWSRARRLRQTPPPAAFEPMSRCSSCGVYLPTTTLSAEGRCGRCAGQAPR
jgi:hypothetical protein